MHTNPTASGSPGPDDPRPDPYAALRADILDGSLADQPLSEVALADRLNVSRTPIREALRRLEQDGLVHRVGRRLVVRPRTTDEIAEMYEVREVLEAAAARAAARRATPADLTAIERAHEALCAAVADNIDPPGMARLTHAYHRAIWTATANATLLGALDRLSATMFTSPSNKIMGPERADMLSEHHHLLAAIRSTDPDAAWTMAIAHMSAARRRELHDLLHNNP